MRNPISAALTVSLLSILPIQAQAGLTDAIGSKISDFVSGRPSTTAAPSTTFSVQQDQPNVPRPASATVALPAGANDCDDLNDRLARRLATTVQVAAPKDTP